MGVLCSMFVSGNDVIAGVEMMDKDNIMAIFVVVTVIGLSIFIISLMNHAFELSNAAPRTKLTVQYDCRLAEISVDYPQQVKEQCRKLLMPRISYGEK
jgi:hypothetical protein